MGYNDGCAQADPTQVMRGSALGGDPYRNMATAAMQTVDNRTGLEKVRDRLDAALDQLGGELELLDGVANRTGYYSEPCEPSPNETGLRGDGLIDIINNKLDAIDDRLRGLVAIRQRLSRIA